MKNAAPKKNLLKISPESALAVRLSAVESKLDRILFLLQRTHKGPVIDPVIMQDAIRAHIRGDRGPMNQIEKLWKSGLYEPPGGSNG